MTPERIAELRRLLVEATALTWVHHSAAVWNALPELLDAAERAIALEAACARKDEKLVREEQLAAYETRMAERNKTRRVVLEERLAELDKERAAVTRSLAMEDDEP